MISLWLALLKKQCYNVIKRLLVLAIEKTKEVTVMETKQIENMEEEIVIELSGCGPNAMVNYAAG